ncbi:unnamed protein product, partial [Rotaria sordida]
PEVQQFLDKLKRQQEAKLNSQENDNRPFILKYVSRNHQLEFIGLISHQIGFGFENLGPDEL